MTPPASAKPLPCLLPLLLLLLHEGAVVAHTDLRLKACDASDKQQLWDFGSKGLGKGDAIIHQETKLCLMVRDCGTAEGSELVVAECSVSCLGGKKAPFTFHHAGGGEPRGLEWGLAPGMYAFAESGADPLVIKPWDTSAALEHQTWLTSAPACAEPCMQYIGKDHTLSVGKETVLCLGAYRDVIPDGDGGWLFDVLIMVTVLLYVGIGVGYNKVRGCSACNIWAAR
jgi:hypothetical protein